MGVLLATASANQPFLLRQALVRGALALLALIGVCTRFALPTASSGGWLASAALLLCLFLGLFFFALLPLRFLTRRFECFESAIVVHDQEIPLETIEAVIWQQRHYQALGLIQTPLVYWEMTIRCLPRTEKDKHGPVYRYSELRYSELSMCYTEAYADSLPNQYHPLRIAPHKQNFDQLPSNKTDASQKP